MAIFRSSQRGAECNRSLTPGLGDRGAVSSSNPETAGYFAAGAPCFATHASYSARGMNRSDAELMQ